MAFELRGRNAVQTRPAPGSPSSEGPPNTLWARNKSSPAAADGYEFGADDANELVGQLRALLGALGGNVAGTGGNELANAMVAALAEKLSIDDGLAGLADAGGFVRMTDAERTKLAALNEGYNGSYVDLAALVSARPTGVAGDWAILQKGAGDDASVAVWDSDNTPAGWVDTEIGPATLDWAAVTGKPASFTPSAHSHPMSDVTGLDAALAALVAQTRTISVAGLATGGGDLSADRTITVAKSNNAQAIAGANDDTAMTPLRTKESIETFASRPSVFGTAVTPTTAAVDFTSIPSWVNKITLNISQLSSNGTAVFLVQLGDSGGIETTGYEAASASLANAAAVSAGASTAGFPIQIANAANDINGQLILTRMNAAGTSWTAVGVFGSNNGGVRISGGAKVLSAALDRIRLTTANGTDVFDAGTVNILIEG